MAKTLNKTTTSILVNVKIRHKCRGIFIDSLYLSLSISRCQCSLSRSINCKATLCCGLPKIRITCCVFHRIYDSTYFLSFLFLSFSFSFFLFGFLIKGRRLLLKLSICPNSKVHKVHKIYIEERFNFSFAKTRGQKSKNIML